MWDFVKGMYVLHSAGPCVTVFGSARLGKDEAAYRLACEFGESLGRAGFSVLTGGGPGLMEAANRGSQAAGARSFGCRMSFTFDQPLQPYFDRCVTVRYFFVRKVVMCRHAIGFLVLPGGIGTLDELFEIMALIQTKHMRPKPIVLIGTVYWAPLVFLLEQMVVAGTVTARDVALIRVTDDIEDAVGFLKESGRIEALEAPVGFAGGVKTTGNGISDAGQVSR